MAELMQLRARPVKAALIWYGTHTLLMQTGQVFKIETSPNGIDILGVTVPSGKTWTVTVQVMITECDA